MTKWIAYLALSLSPLLLTGCIARDVDPYPHIRVVDAASVTGCTHKGNVSANSNTLFGFLSETARNSIIRMAKKEAAKLNATHVVLTEPISNDSYMSTNGMAYICP